MAALDGLHGDRPFLVRCYVHYPSMVEAPPRPEVLLGDRRRLDLVACFRDPGEDLVGWVEFLRGLLRRYGANLATLQIAEEPNNARQVEVLDIVVRTAVEADLNITAYEHFATPTAGGRRRCTSWGC